ncbi:hypothetical protein NM208_g2510 [Fusarium decemcellulare]|uniref:Uncharacterized protein n=1 Tax=Fusarium decemcellulare TaxID=57161 RepID=A0ACC1SSE6_9HYPO|nr:hypothetical protein NM208_g2510 [Fusarium decemcellulare]
MVLPLTMGVTGSSPQTACGADTQQAAELQTGSARTTETRSEANHGMLSIFIYDTTSIQDRLIQGPVFVSSPRSTTATTTTIATISSLLLHHEKGPNGSPNDKKEQQAKIKGEWAVHNKL